MCVAITLMPGAILSEDEIQKMGRANADGVGVAWAHAGQVHWLKAVKYSPKYVANLVERWAGSPRLVHFRLSTAGGTRADLCHPFEISPVANCAPVGSGDLAMIHNGHWGQWDTLLKVLKSEDLLPDEGPWSDTRLIAYLSHSDPDWLNVLGGKVATMDGQGQITHMGEWAALREGIQVSNFHWNQEYAYKRGGYSGYRQWPGWEWESEDWKAFQTEKEHQEQERRKASIKAAEERRAKNLEANKKELEAKKTNGTTINSTSTNGRSTGDSHGAQGQSQTAQGANGVNGKSHQERWEAIEAARQARITGGVQSEPGAGSGAIALTPEQRSAAVINGDGGQGRDDYRASVLLGTKLDRAQRAFFGRNRAVGTGAYDTRPWRNPVSGCIYAVSDDGRMVEVTAAYSTATAAVVDTLEQIYWDDGRCGDAFEPGACAGDECGPTPGGFVD